MQKRRGENLVGAKMGWLLIFAVVLAVINGFEIIDETTHEKILEEPDAVDTTSTQTGNAAAGGDNLDDQDDQEITNEDDGDAFTITNGGDLGSGFPEADEEDIMNMVMNEIQRDMLNARAMHSMVASRLGGAISAGANRSSDSPSLDEEFEQMAASMNMDVGSLSQSLLGIDVIEGENGEIMIGSPHLVGFDD